MYHGPKIVDSSAERPAGKVGECFYCWQPIGAEHAADCVIQQRTIVCRIIVDVIRDVPNDWDRHIIEWRINKGSYCANNVINDLSLITEDHCFCEQLQAMYLREATEEDESSLGLPQSLRSEMG